MPDDASPAPASSSGVGNSPFARTGVRLGAIAVVALAAAFVTWLILDGDEETTGTATTAPPPTLVGTTPKVSVARPAIASVAQLRRAAAASGVPIYWIGPRPGTRIELTRAPGGTAFVRYLPPGVRAGSTRRYLTVATYPRPSGFEEVRNAAKQAGAKTIRLAGGGIAVYTGDRATNVHVGYPEQPYQVEVFAPAPGVVAQLASRGAVRPVD